MKATIARPPLYAEASELLRQSFPAIDGFSSEGESVAVGVISVGADKDSETCNLTAYIEPYVPRISEIATNENEMADVGEFDHEENLDEPDEYEVASDEHSYGFEERPHGLAAAVEDRMAFLNAEPVLDDIFEGKSITLYDDDTGRELSRARLDDDWRAVFVGIPAEMICRLELHQSSPLPPPSRPTKRITKLVATMAAVLLVGFLTGAKTFQARPQWLNWLFDSSAPLRHAFQFDNGEAFQSSGSRVWTAGSVKTEIFKRVELVVEPALPEETPGNFEETLGKDSSDKEGAPFRLWFDSPDDGIRRTATLRFEPHTDVADALQELSEGDSLLQSALQSDNTAVKKSNIACTVYGALVDVPDNAPPQIKGEPVIDGSTARFTLRPQTGSGFVTVVLRDGKGGFLAGNVQAVYMADDGSIQPVEVEIGVGATGTYQVIPVAAVYVDSVEGFRQRLREGKTEDFYMGKQLSVQVKPN